MEIETLKCYIQEIFFFFFSFLIFCHQKANIFISDGLWNFEIEIFFISLHYFYLII